MTRGRAHGEAVATALIAVACAGPVETGARQALTHHPMPAVEGAARQPTTQALPSDLGGYFAHAAQGSPVVRAGFARWQGAVHGIAGARSIPQPSVSFDYFIQSVQTRVGPQRARVGIRQSLPWPSGLVAESEAAASEARAAQRSFEASLLAVRRSVAVAYWDLWELRTTRRIHVEHLAVIEDLAEAASARLSTGESTLADQQQVELEVARIEDNILGMKEAERGAEARLRAEVGLTASTPVPTPSAPPERGLPKLAASSLAAEARAHPSVQGRGSLADASESAARVARAERLPKLALGAGWIVTDALEDGAGGEDAFTIGAGLEVPLWQRSRAARVQAAESEAQARRAEQDALRDRTEAELISGLAALRDAHRRVELHTGTLVPQAKAAHASVLGSYVVGRTGVAQALLAQRDLLEIRIALESARASHARAWARVEEAVGRALE